MTCPDCRADVQHQPAPAFLIREITQTFVNTAALLPAGETTEDHRKAQVEEAGLVEKDKASRVSGGGLFNGRFNVLHRYRSPIRDASDDVDRSLEELLGEDPDHINFVDIDERTRRRHSLTEHVHQHAGLPFNNRPHRFRRLSGSINETSDEGDFSDDSGSTGSLRDFVADEMGTDNAGADSDHLSDLRPGTSTYDSGSEHLSDDDEPSSPPFDLGSNTNPIITARRRCRGRRVAISSPDLNVSDSDNTHSTQQIGQDHEDYSMRGGFSPLQSSPDGSRFQDVPIQIDSDSDAPPVRPVGRRRKRPLAISISSDEEDNGTRGVDIPRSRSSQASSDRTARNGHQLSAASDSPPSPIDVGPRSARPTIPSRFSSRSSSPRLVARHHRVPSAPPAEDASMESQDSHDGPSVLSRTTSAGPSNSRETLRPSLARMRERSERRVLQSRSPSNVQHREERKRLKRQLRASRRPERASREGWNRLDPPQQLAYIGE
ncbi:MAG: hypothetical protein Q9178_006407 [Gyalolechia marmorata]